jgi:hypothetical protein
MVAQSVGAVAVSTFNNTTNPSDHDFHVLKSPRNDASEPDGAYKRTSVFSKEAQVIPKSLSDSIAATQVEYRQVGKSGLRVSNPILGTLGLGDSRWLPWCMGEEQVRAPSHY